MSNWYDKYLTIYGKSPDEIPDVVLDEIKEKLAKKQVTRRREKTAKDDYKVSDRNFEDLDGEYDDLTEDESSNQMDAKDLDRMYLNHVLRENNRRAAGEGADDEEPGQYQTISGGIANNSDLTGGSRQGGKGWWQI